MSRKKIIFVIVEGVSDKYTLGVLLDRIYKNNHVYTHVMYHDITSELGSNPENIVKKVGNCVKNYAGRTFKPKDFLQIIHIADTDGAFISDDNIVENAGQETTLYSTTKIYAKSKAKIEKRNQQKSENLNRLVSTSKVWSIPYQIYYMSCNLDHVLHGKINSTDEEKEKDSIAFAKKYKNNIEGFLEFISESDFSVVTNYRQSWQYISEESHSLERHTNLGLCFKNAETGSELL